MMRASRILIITSLLSIVPLSAYAADLAPQPVEPEAPILTAYSWTGFYAGINGGYGFGSSHTVHMTETNALNSADYTSDNYGKLSSKGGFGGIQAGYNWQYGNVVLGLEGDIQGAGISDKTTATGASTGYILTTKSQTNWFGTVRPRVGYAFDNIMVYATGGVAFGDAKYKQGYLDPGVNPYASSPSKNDTRVGYAVGGGIEYGITQNWSVKLEYQYIDLGSTTVRGNEINDGAPSRYSINTKLRTDFHTVRLGLNYRF